MRSKNKILENMRLLAKIILKNKRFENTWLLAITSTMDIFCDAQIYLELQQIYLELYLESKWFCICMGFDTHNFSNYKGWHLMIVYLYGFGYSPILYIFRKIWDQQQINIFKWLCTNPSIELISGSNKDT